MKTRTKYLLEKGKPFLSAKCSRSQEEDEETMTRQDFQKLLTNYIIIQGKVAQHLSMEEVRRESKEMKLLFSELNIRFSELKNPYGYLSLIRKYVRERGVKVSHMVKCLQAKFSNHYKMEWKDHYSWINRLTMDYDYFILGNTNPQPFINLY